MITQRQRWVSLGRENFGLRLLFFASYGLGVAPIGLIKAIYPATWGLLQLVTGSLSDRWGRKWAWRPLFTSLLLSPSSLGTGLLSE